MEKLVGPEMSLSLSLWLCALREPECHCLSRSATSSPDELQRRKRRRVYCCQASSTNQLSLPPVLCFCLLLQYHFNVTPQVLYGKIKWNKTIVPVLVFRFAPGKIHQPCWAVNDHSHLPKQLRRYLFNHKFSKHLAYYVDCPKQVHISNWKSQNFTSFDMWLTLPQIIQACSYSFLHSLLKNHWNYCILTVMMSGRWLDHCNILYIT